MRRKTRTVVVLAVVALAIGLSSWLWDGARTRSGRRSGETASGMAHGAAAVDRASMSEFLAIRRRIAGRVVFEGRPIAAIVRVFAESTTGSIDARAGADGRFAFEVPVGKYNIGASAPGLVRGFSAADVRAGDRSDLELVLTACTRELVGTVIDSSGGAPIEGAQIDGGWMLTDKDGRFAWCDDEPPNQTTTITAAADGFAAEQRQLWPDQTDVDFALRPEVTISGIIVGPDRAAIAGASLSLSPVTRSANMQTTNMHATASCDAAGRFVMRGLGAGEYEVRSSAAGFVHAEPTRAIVEVANNAELVIAMRVADVIRGVAYANGKPVAGAAIVWRPDSNLGGGETRTRDDGTFEIADTVYGRGVFHVDRHESVTLVVGPAPVVLELRPSTAIRGRVVHDGKPVAGADITGQVMPVKAESDGTFVVEPHGAGTFELVATSAVLGGFSDPVSVEVSEGQTVDGVVLDIAFTASIAGVVVDQDGRPVARARVQWSNAQLEDHGEAISRPDGSFRAAMLSGGDGVYASRVLLDGQGLPSASGEPLEVRVPTARSAITGQRIAVVVKRATIAGRVVDEAGAPVPDASVEARPGYSGGRAWGSNVVAGRADAEGRFSLHVVATSGYVTYGIDVEGPPGMHAFAANVRPGTQGLRVVLREPGSVHVVCPGAPPGTTVDLRSQENTTHAGVCGSTVSRVPPGMLFGHSRDGAIGQVAVTRTATAEIRIQHHDVRDVRVTVQRAGAPAKSAHCTARYIGSSQMAGRGSPPDDTKGVVTLQLARLHADVQCTGFTGSIWVSRDGSIEPSVDALTIELP